jgi:NTE family protein
MAKKKALVLSGGGARGAYHIGVIEALVAHGWMEDGVGPDIIAGTSIGAINAAALASGLRVEQLKQRWLRMHTEEVHRLSADLPPLVRPLIRFLLRSVLTSQAHGGDSSIQPPDDESMTARGMIDRLGDLFRSRPFRSLLETRPWRQTLSGWMDFERINSAQAPALLLAATELQTGSLRIFCNRDLPTQAADQITLDHLMASSSIPIIYPWTEIGENKYWDGAVLANTPLEPVIDLAGEEDVEIIVVMMTPWHSSEEAMREQTRRMPEDLVQALTLTLDWALLASYRVAFEMLQHRNQLAEAMKRLEIAAQATGDDSLRLLYKKVRPIQLPTVIAPQQMMPLEWIIDYEDGNHRKLFEQGYADAERAMTTHTNGV